MEELCQTIADRFGKGIRKSFKPCPLIGPKWVQAHPNGKPADFQFLGVRKLAKAMGFSPAKILTTLTDAVRLDDLDLDVTVTDDFVIQMNRANGKAPQAAPARKADKPPRGKRDPAGDKPARPKPKGTKAPNRHKKKNPKPRPKKD